METNLKTIFYDNPLIDGEIDAFLDRDPEFVRIRQEFYETAHEIAQLVGFEQYDRFERLLGDYIVRLSDLHYLFGLGLRQEVLRAIAADQPTPPPLP